LRGRIFQQNLDIRMDEEILGPSQQWDVSNDSCATRTSQIRSSVLLSWQLLVINQKLCQLFRPN
jgi:hypothetical protein